MLGGLEAGAGRSVPSRGRRPLLRARVDNPGRLGKPLRFELEGLHCARRGDYRVIYRIDPAVHCVQIVAIEHRSNVIEAQRCYRAASPRADLTPRFRGMRRGHPRDGPLRMATAMRRLGFGMGRTLQVGQGIQMVMFSLCMISAWSIQNHCRARPTRHAKVTMPVRILGNEWGGGLPTRTNNRGKEARK